MYRLQPVAERFYHLHRRSVQSAQLRVSDVEARHEHVPRQKFEMTAEIVVVRTRRGGLEIRLRVDPVEHIFHTDLDARFSRDGFELLIKFGVLLRRIVVAGMYHAHFRAEYARDLYRAAYFGEHFFIEFLVPLSHRRERRVRLIAGQA